MKRKSYIKKIGRKIIPSFLRPWVRVLYRRMKNFLKYGQSDLFLAVEFENITACNRRCSYCPNYIYERGLLKNKKLMPESLFKKIIDELAKINFSGRISPCFYGEPLLDDRIAMFIEYINKKLPKSEISIFTNGDFLTLELYKGLTVAGADIFVITEHSQNMTESMQQLLKDFHQVDYRDDYFLHDTAYILNDNNQGIILYKDIKQRSLYNRGGLVKDVKPKKIDPVCEIPSNSLLIDYAGNIVLCCNDYFSTIKFGNLNNESILEIWNKKNFKKIRQDLKKGILNLEICKKCKK